MWTRGPPRSTKVQKSKLHSSQYKNALQITINHYNKICIEKIECCAHVDALKDVSSKISNHVLFFLKKSWYS